MHKPLVHFYKHCSWGSFLILRKHDTYQPTSHQHGVFSTEEPRNPELKYRGWGRNTQGERGLRTAFRKEFQTLTEAVMCLLETGQRRQQYVSVIFLISTLGMWMGRKVNRWMEQTHHSAMGASAHSDHLVLSSNARSVSPSK